MPKSTSRARKASRAPARSTRPLLDEGFGPRRRPPTSPLGWIFEPFEGEDSYLRRRMFGCDAAYLDGLLYLVTATKDEPWNGLLVGTSRDRHEALIRDWPSLEVHAVLGKWLYVSQDAEGFERTAQQLARAALARDPRMGVAPTPKQRKKKKRSVRGTR